MKSTPGKPEVKNDNILEKLSKAIVPLTPVENITRASDSGKASRFATLPYRPGDKGTMPRKGLEEFDQIVTIRTTKDIKHLWKMWKERVRRSVGYDSNSRAFELALAEALNTPEESHE